MAGTFVGEAFPSATPVGGAWGFSLAIRDCDFSYAVAPTRNSVAGFGALNANHFCQCAIQ